MVNVSFKQELHKRYPDGLPRLDPVEDMGIRSVELSDAMADIKSMEDALQHNTIHQVSTQEVVAQRQENYPFCSSMGRHDLFIACSQIYRVDVKNGSPFCMVLRSGVLQAEKDGDGKKLPLIQRKAWLQDRAEELRSLMQDSQLHSFRAESRNRCDSNADLPCSSSQW